MKQSLIINSTDTSGNKRQKTFTDINPDVSNETFAIFGQSFMELSDDTYLSTDRIIKLNADTDQDYTDSSSSADNYSNYLIIDSPFDTDLTDNCGKIWTPTGNPVIQNGKLYLDGSSFLSTSDVTLGGQDFTIQATLALNTSTASNPRIFYLRTPAPLEYDIFDLYMQKQTDYYQLKFRTHSELFTGGATSNMTVNSPSNQNLNINYEQEFNISFEYVHGVNGFFIYFNDAPYMTFYAVTKQMTTGFHLGAFNNANEKSVGYYSNLKVYDGIAIHTPHTASLSDN